jgi:apolipoprotein N-acyltransferase
VIITIIKSNKQSSSSYSTYVGDSMKYLWIGIGISFFVLSIIISQTPGSWYIAYPFFIMFYGLGTFVSGMFLKFKPLIIGGIFNWVLACVCVLLPYDYQLLMAAAAILTSYIIPGHIIQPLKSK